MNDQTQECTIDLVKLKKDYKKSLRKKKFRALFLICPLFIFILVLFIIPIVNMMFLSVDNSQIIEYLPQTIQAIENNPFDRLPNETVYQALAEDLRKSRKDKTIGKLSSRMNRLKDGTVSLFKSTARKVQKAKDISNYKEWFIEQHETWGDVAIWKIIKKESDPYTFSYYFSAVDMHYNENAEVVAYGDEDRIYLLLFWRTLWISFLIVVFTFLLGYPVAAFLAGANIKYQNLLLILVILPFWTSLLVRTTAWIVILQTEGVLNDIFVWLNLYGDEDRVRMIYNLTGTLVAMTHILLPFMILPIYSVMKNISPSYFKASLSLGANPVVSFFKVYLPMTLPGVGAGTLLVFILAVGYYITPALVGGQSGQLISNLIAFHMQRSLNWGLATALGTILLFGILALYWAYNKIVGIQNLKIG